MTADLASRIVVLSVVAFGFWVVLLWALRRVSNPLGGLAAAVLSWSGASVAVGWLVIVLRRVGYWPLV
jgi:hypothetical protein